MEWYGILIIVVVVIGFVALSIFNPNKTVYAEEEVEKEIVVPILTIQHAKYIVENELEGNNLKYYNRTKKITDERVGRLKKYKLLFDKTLSGNIVFRELFDLKESISNISLSPFVKETDFTLKEAITEKEYYCYLERRHYGNWHVGVFNYKRELEYSPYNIYVKEVNKSLINSIIDIKVLNEVRCDIDLTQDIKYLHEVIDKFRFTENEK